RRWPTSKVGGRSVPQGSISSSSRWSCSRRLLSRFRRSERVFVAAFGAERGTVATNRRPGFGCLLVNRRSESGSQLPEEFGELVVDLRVVSDDEADGEEEGSDFAGLSVQIGFALIVARPGIALTHDLLACLIDHSPCPRRDRRLDQGDQGLQVYVVLLPTWF